MERAARHAIQETKRQHKENVLSDIAEAINPERIKINLLDMGIAQNLDINFSKYNIDCPPIDIPQGVILSRDSISQELIGRGYQRLWNDRDLMKVDRQEYSLQHGTLDTKEHPGRMFFTTTDIDGAKNLIVLEKSKKKCHLHIYPSKETLTNTTFFNY